MGHVGLTPQARRGLLGNQWTENNQPAGWVSVD
jgi:hypothetical protein